MSDGKKGNAESPMISLNDIPDLLNSQALKSFILKTPGGSETALCDCEGGRCGCNGPDCDKNGKQIPTTMEGIIRSDDPDVAKLYDEYRQNAENQEKIRLDIYNQRKESIKKILQDEILRLQKIQKET